jgi:hypothetical protein
MQAVNVLKSAPELGAMEKFFHAVRRASRSLTADLTDADATAQSMPDASPAKWHLAHTTWFFENMVLVPHLPGYRLFDDRFNFLFNSYYEALGDRHPRPARGLLTRPTLDTVYAYREHVDAGIAKLLTWRPGAEVSKLIELGCHHEQQHQELLLTDILHLFAQSPLRPAFKAPEPLPVNDRSGLAIEYLPFWSPICWPTARSPIGNGCNSSSTAATPIPCFGSRRAGMRFAPRGGPRPCTGKSMRMSIGR